MKSAACSQNTRVNLLSCLLTCLHNSGYNYYFVSHNRHDKCWSKAKKKTNRSRPAWPTLCPHVDGLGLSEDGPVRAAHMWAAPPAFVLRQPARKEREHFSRAGSLQQQEDTCTSQTPSSRGKKLSVQSTVVMVSMLPWMGPLWMFFLLNITFCFQLSVWRICHRNCIVFARNYNKLQWGISSFHTNMSELVTLHG